MFGRRRKGKEGLEVLVWLQNKSSDNKWRLQPRQLNFLHCSLARMEANMLLKCSVLYTMGGDTGVCVLLVPAKKYFILHA